MDRIKFFNDVLTSEAILPFHKSERYTDMDKLTRKAVETFEQYISLYDDEDLKKGFDAVRELYDNLQCEAESYGVTQGMELTNALTSIIEHPTKARRMAETKYFPVYDLFERERKICHTLEEKYNRAASDEHTA